MPRVARDTRRQILDAGYTLFYRKGFARVGVDDIASLAGVTKRTLYYHFASKDDLLAAVLEHQHGLAMERIRRHDERYVGSAETIVTAVFADLAKWSQTPGWTGAGFTRLAMELADMPGHPARTAAHRHKLEVQGWWTDLLTRAEVKQASDRARDIMLLMEGAMVLMLIHRDRAYAATAAQAALKIIALTDKA
jgi:AcrR family transcriptional regulator